MIIGLLKGGIIGGGLGFGFMYLGKLGQIGAVQYVFYALVGALVGLIAGRPIWKQETFWTPAIKMVFGAAVGAGLYALATRVLGDPGLPFIGQGAGKLALPLPPGTAAGAAVKLSTLPYVLGGIIGIVYGIFVEVDDADAGGRDEKKP